MIDRVNRRLALATLFAFLVLFFAPVLFWAVEHNRSTDVHSIGDAYGWLFRTLFENSSPYKLKTPFGFIAYWTVRVADVSLVAFMTATIASRFAFIRGNPSNADDLGRAGLERVSTVIVLADESNVSNEPDDVDARSLLTTLAVESINPQAYSCNEVLKSENRPHFERTHADELVVSAELTERTVRDAITVLKDAYDSLLVGVFVDGVCQVNPANDLRLAAGHELLVVRERPVVVTR